MGKHRRKTRESHTNEERWPTNIDRQHRANAWKFGESPWATGTTAADVADQPAAPRASESNPHQRHGAASTQATDATRAPRPQQQRRRRATPGARKAMQPKDASPTKDRATDNAGAQAAPTQLGQTACGQVSDVMRSHPQVSEEPTFSEEPRAHDPTKSSREQVTGGGLCEINSAEEKGARRTRRPRAQRHALRMMRGTGEGSGKEEVEPG